MGKSQSETHLNSQATFHVMLYFDIVKEGFWHFVPSVNDMTFFVCSIYCRGSNYHLEVIMERNI